MHAAKPLAAPQVMQGKFDAAIAQREKVAGGGAAMAAAAAAAVTAPPAPKPTSLLPPAAAAVVHHEQQQAAVRAAGTHPMSGLPHSPMVAAAVVEGPAASAAAVEEA